MGASEAKEKWLMMAQNDGVVSFYGCMYGYADVGEKILAMNVNLNDLSKTEECFFYIWGYPGPDFNTYEFSDYGKTWAFNIEDFKHEVEFIHERWVIKKVGHGC